VLLSLIPFILGLLSGSTKHISSKEAVLHDHTYSRRHCCESVPEIRAVFLVPNLHDAFILAPVFLVPNLHDAFILAP